MATNEEKPKRRIVKKAETVREKAEKSRVVKEKPKKQGVLGLVGRYIAAPFKFVGRPLAKLGRFKVFRILGRILLPPYVRNSWKELRLVTWPKRKESWQLTLAVIIFSIIFGAIIAAVDYVLDKVFREVLLK